MKDIDTFDFKTMDAGTAKTLDAPGTEPHNPHIDYTPYDDDVSKIFRAEEPGPDPFDSTPWGPDSPAIDLLTWALDQIA